MTPYATGSPAEPDVNLLIIICYVFVVRFNVFCLHLRRIWVIQRLKPNLKKFHTRMKTFIRVLVKIYPFQQIATNINIFLITLPCTCRRTVDTV